LPGRDWKAMGLFHVTDIAKFQIRMDAIGDQRERSEDLITPAHSAARGHGRADQLWSHQPAAASAAQPGECLVKSEAELGEVEHGLRDPGSRRSLRRVA